MSENDFNTSPRSRALCKIFYDGIAECEYKNIQHHDDPEVPFAVITSYYDANEVLRKEIFSKYNRINEMKLYDENGRILKALSISLASEKIFVYLEDYENYNNDNSNQVKLTRFSIDDRADYAIEKEFVCYIDGD